MTAKRDLKKRVRERQARTGESYTSAREQVLAARAPELVPVIELVDVSAEATRLGLVCRALMVPTLAERVDAATVLARLRTALLATEGDPSTAFLRRVLLRGEPAGPMPLGTVLEGVEAARRFMARARAGIGGASEGGRMLALHVDGRVGSETIVCMLWPSPPAYATPGRPATLIMWPPENVFALDDLAGVRLP